LPQNFAPGAAGVWHFGQTAAVVLTACPQLPQNFDPGVSGDWHFVHVAAAATLWLIVLRRSRSAG